MLNQAFRNTLFRLSCEKKLMAFDCPANLQTLVQLTRYCFVENYIDLRVYKFYLKTPPFYSFYRFATPGCNAPVVTRILAGKKRHFSFQWTICERGRRISNMRERLKS